MQGCASEGLKEMSDAGIEAAWIELKAVFRPWKCAAFLLGRGNFLWVSLCKPP